MEEASETVCKVIKAALPGVPQQAPPCIEHCCCLLLWLAGDVVGYFITVVNNGNVALRHLNFSTPTAFTNSSCMETPLDARLEVGAMQDCVLYYRILQDDIEQGGVTKLIDLSAAPSSGMLDPFHAVLALANVTATASPAISATMQTSTCSLPQFAGGW